MTLARSFLLWIMFIGTTAILTATEMTPSKRVALIIDDGPSAQHMTAFLELFSREGVRVSFAHVGQNVAAHPELTRAAATAGHQIVNHSRTHAHFKQLDDAAIVQEVRETEQAVTAATGRGTQWFWPPYGDWDERIAKAVASAGLQPLPVHRLHFVSSEDWNREMDADTIRRRATTDIRDMTLILFHEWREETLAQMPAIITELKRQGCRFLTVSELTAALEASG